MPGGRDLVVGNGYEYGEDVTLKEAEVGLEAASVIEASKAIGKAPIHWPLVACSQDMYGLKCAGFIHDDEYEDDDQIHFVFPSRARTLPPSTCARWRIITNTKLSFKSRRQR